MKLVLSITYVVVLGILMHYFGESLPRRFFLFDRFPYKPFPFEKEGRVYEAVGVRKWKTRVPDMSRIMKDMLPKKIERGADSKAIRALIKETCVAEFVHKLLCVLGIGIYFIWKNYIGVLLSMLFTLCNLPFIIIQRYNRPHLIRLMRRLEEREEKKSEQIPYTVV